MTAPVSPDGVQPSPTAVRVAAVGDIHFGMDSAGTFGPHLEHLAELADVLLIAGDLTRGGEPEEAGVFAGEIAQVPIPAFTVLGNHDYHAERVLEIRRIVEDAGVRVLECESAVVEVRGVRLGIAGAKGFGGGFPGACATDFGEPEMKAFVGHTRDVAAALESQLASLDTDVRVALLHYSPVEGTLRGERLEIYPFLGSYLLGEAVDRAGANLAVHGHAHGGTEKGVTPGGVHVRNVAQPVIKHAYHVYELEPHANIASVAAG